MTQERKPSCYAANLILENRKLNGGLLKYLQKIKEPTYDDLLAKNILENAHNWQEEELYKKEKL